MKLLKLLLISLSNIPHLFLKFVFTFASIFTNPLLLHLFLKLSKERRKETKLLDWINASFVALKWIGRSHKCKRVFILETTFLIAREVAVKTGSKWICINSSRRPLAC